MRIGASALLLAALSLLPPAPARAQTDHLIEHDTGRMTGGRPVLVRAILSAPAAGGPPAGQTAVLLFRGSPGYANIQSPADKQRNLIPFMRSLEQVLRADGIALVIMDCPTDQWGEYGGPGPTNCFDDYRASPRHAEDVRGIMAKLRTGHGYTRFYLLGHSMGTLSSRWLAKHLGADIAGSIHSASINVPNPKGYARSITGFPYASITTPILHVHNEKDACRGTPYDLVKAYAGGNLLTVRGGVPEGNPCGAGHLHSHQGLEEPVARAILGWIRTGRAPPSVGG